MHIKLMIFYIGIAIFLLGANLVFSDDLPIIDEHVYFGQSHMSEMVLEDNQVVNNKNVRHPGINITGANCKCTRFEDGICIEGDCT